MQVLPVIRGQVSYPDVIGSPFNGYSLIFGNFWAAIGGHPPPTNNSIARLQADGTLDTIFVSSLIYGEIRVRLSMFPVASLQDKILIWGRFNAFAGATQYTNLARLNADGSLDTTLSSPHIL